MFLGIFGRKIKKLVAYPNRYAIVAYTDAALRDGVLDDFLKEVRVYENGRVIEVIPFTEEVVDAFAKFMPVSDRTINVELERLPVLAVDDPGEVSYEEGEKYSNSQTAVGNATYGWLDIYPADQDPSNANAETVFSVPVVNGVASNSSVTGLKTSKPYRAIF